MTAANDSNSENNHDPEKYSPTNKDSLFILYGCDKKITQNPHLVEDLADEAREQTGAKLVKKDKKGSSGRNNLGLSACRGEPYYSYKF